MGLKLTVGFWEQFTQSETCQNRIETRRPEIHHRIPGIAIEIETETEIEIETEIVTSPKGIAREETTTKGTTITTAVEVEGVVRLPNPSP